MQKGRFQVWTIETGDYRLIRYDPTDNETEARRVFRAAVEIAPYDWHLLVDNEAGATIDSHFKRGKRHDNVIMEVARNG